MKLAIIGSRNITNINIAKYIANMPIQPTCIVSGGASGVDSLAAQFAAANNIELMEFRPDYKKHGRGATFIRNRQIVEAADIVFAFWDGISRGTLYTINHAKKMGKQVITINPLLNDTL